MSVEDISRGMGVFKGKSWPLRKNEKLHLFWTKRVKSKKGGVIIEWWKEKIGKVST